MEVCGKFVEIGRQVKNVQLGISEVILTRWLQITKISQRALSMEVSVLHRMPRTVAGLDQSGTGWQCGILIRRMTIARENA